VMVSYRSIYHVNSFFSFEFLFLVLNLLKMIRGNNSHFFCSFVILFESVLGLENR